MQATTRLLILSTALTLGATPAAAQQATKEAVLAVAQSVFDAMARRDTAALRDLVHPAAHLIAAVEVGDSVAPRTSSKEQFLAQVGGSPAGALLERMWNAEVRISGPIATVWTQYDFHRAGQWSHCGIDSFQLVKNGRRWQVTSIIYTIVPAADRCKSPLGPPR